MSYSEKVGQVFNNELIKRVCLDIDNGHYLSGVLKSWLPMLISASVDLSINSLSNQPYQEAYDFVISELNKEQPSMSEVHG